MSRPLLQRIDVLSLAAAVLAFLVTAFYVFLVLAEGDRPPLFALLLLGLGVAGAAYAVRLKAPGRRVVLGVAAIFLFLLGFVAIFTIGLPLILAAVLCVLGALRTPEKDWRDTV